MCLFCFWLILVIWYAFHSDLLTLSTLVNRWWHDCPALMHSPVVLIFDGPWKRVKSMANTTKNMQHTGCSGGTLPGYFRFPRPCPQVFTRPISCIWICYFISKNKFLLPPLFFFALFRWCCCFFLCCVWKGVWKWITSLEPSFNAQSCWAHLWWTMKAREINGKYYKKHATHRMFRGHFAGIFSFSTPVPTSFHSAHILYLNLLLYI